MRSEKKLMVDVLRERIKNSNSMIFTHYTGLDAQSMDKLRSASRAEKSRYMVVKNSLLKIAAKEEKIEDLGVDLKGSVGVIFGENDAVGIAKASVDFAKENEAFSIDGGFLDSKPLSKADIIHLANLPSREELIAKLVGQLNAPISGLVGCLSGLLRNMVSVLNQIKEQKEKAGT